MEVEAAEVAVAASNGYCSGGNFKARYIGESPLTQLQSLPKLESLTLHRPNPPILKVLEKDQPKACANAAVQFCSICELVITFSLVSKLIRSSTEFHSYLPPEMGAGEVDCSSSNLWLAPNPSKRWGEVFFLIYTPFWLTLCLGIVVPYKLYENFTEWEYLFLGLVSALPAFIIPMIFVGKADSSLCWKDRYWVKANLWIILFSYVGNYFWTHYFFTVLGASYTFPSWKMNNVPHTTFLLTHVCFLFYHVTSNMTLRRIQHSIAHLPEKTQWLFKSAWILALSYFVAYLETLAISNFPYYEFVDRASMYTVGSLFYAIYFFVSFPMFLRIDEKASDAWDLPRVAIDALGAAMLVTIILDLWRIFLGPIVPIPDSKQCLQPGLPWFPSTA